MLDGEFVPAPADYNFAFPARADNRRVLAIDETGERTIVAAVVLEELERRAGRPAAELFDLILGSSTGGLLALLLACPRSVDTRALYDVLEREFARGRGVKGRLGIGRD